MREEHFLFLEKLYFHSQNCCFECFIILSLLDFNFEFFLSRFEWTNFASINFMMFSQDVNHNIGLDILYLPFGNHLNA
jgi:hypothetical protein